MRRVLSACLAFALFGCVESALNPDDPVELTGKAVDEDGSPLKGLELMMERSSNSSCVFDKSYDKLTVSDDGSFTKQMVGKDTRNGEVARCFSLAIPERPEGRSLRAKFLIQVTDVELPELRLWKGGLKEEIVGSDTKLKFSALNTTHHKSVNPDLVVKNSEGIAFERKDVSTEVVLAPHLVEDFELAASLHAAYEHKGSGTTFTVDLDSDRLALTKGKLIPASRGAACSYTGSVGACPLTDGKLAPITLSTNERRVQELTVDLGTPKTLKKAVLRDLQFFGGQAVLEGSADNGTTWVKLADLGVQLSSFYELDLLATSPVQTVRLRVLAEEANAETSVRQLGELSVFE